MPLTHGTTLGPYRVTAKIGEGGMGEVYRARDTKLDWDVALKVLAQAFTDARLSASTNTVGRISAQHVFLSADSRRLATRHRPRASRRRFRRRGPVATTAVCGGS